MSRWRGTCSTRGIYRSDRRPSQSGAHRERLARRRGARECGSFAEAAAASDVLPLMVLPTSPRGRGSSVWRRSGVAPAVKPGPRHRRHGNLRYPADTRRLAARVEEALGGRFLDAPVTGGVEAAARAAALTVMVGGEPAVLGLDPAGARCPSARRFTTSGSIGAGHAAKLIQNTFDRLDRSGRHRRKDLRWRKRPASSSAPSSSCSRIPTRTARSCR